MLGGFGSFLKTSFDELDKTMASSLADEPSPPPLQQNTTAPTVPPEAIAEEPEKSEWRWERESTPAESGWTTREPGWTSIPPRQPEQTPKPEKGGDVSGVVVETDRGIDLSPVKGEPEEEKIEIARLKEALAAREKQLEASHAELAKLTSISNATEDNDMEAVKAEFSNRFAAMEQRMQHLIREKEELAKHNTQLSSTEDKVSQLMEEGQRLAKKQLEMETIIKRLRLKESTMTTEVETLTERLHQSTEKCTELQDDVRRLNSVNADATATAKDRDSKDKELTQALQHVKDLQTALDKAWNETIEAKNAKSECEMLHKQALKEASTAHASEKAALAQRHKGELQSTKHDLEWQLAELRKEVTRGAEQADWKEAGFQREMSGLRERLEAEESRNRDLAGVIPDATRPLLRQIESLKTQHASQMQSWESIERSLQDRVALAESRASAAVASVHTAEMSALDAVSAMEVLQSQVTELRSERTRLMSELEASKAECEVERAKAESTRQELQRVHVDKMQASSAFQERESAMQSAIDRLREELTVATRPVTPVTPVKPVVVDPTYAIPAGSDRLQSRLNLREGEISSLRGQLDRMEKERATIAEELVRETARAEQLESQAAESSRLGEMLKESQFEFEATLQLLGEKTEQVDDLEADLREVRQLYRSQIAELSERVLSS